MKHYQRTVPRCIVVIALVKKDSKKTLKKQGNSTKTAQRRDKADIFEEPKHPLPSRKAWLVAQPKSKVSSVQLVRQMRNESY